MASIAVRAPSGTRAYVIDDQSEIRKSLHFLFGTIGVTTWPFASPIDFLDQIDTLPVAPVLLDIRMPELDGVEVMRKIAASGRQWPVIVMTAHGDVSNAVQMMKLGVIEFLEKPFELAAAVGALDRAYDTLASAEETTGAAQDARERFAVLTPREADVVAHLLKGAQNKVVAATLGLSTRTVESYRANALQKLGTRNIVETMALASCASWTGPGPKVH